MTYPALIVLALLLWSFSWPKEKLVYLLFGLSAFGALAVIPPSWVGGADLLPSSLAALILAGRYFIDRRFRATMFHNAFALDRLGLFTAFMVVAAFSAFFFPRIFAGQAEVAAMRATANGATDLLGPTSANFTQLAYLCVTYGVTLALFSSANEPGFVERLMRSFVLGAFVLIVTGLIDLALGGSGSSPLIAPFKTAQYAMLTGAEVLGVKRISGFMSEASAYGAPCVVYATLALFAAPTFPARRMRMIATIVALGAIVMAALSTSSTAFVGLALLAVLYVLNLARRTASVFWLRNKSFIRSKVLAEFGLVLLVGLGVAASLAFSPEIFAVPAAFVDTLIFKKTLSGSYYERMMWNQMALHALEVTHGFGVGVGGARTSNWIVAVVTNTGILGALLLFGYISFTLTWPKGRTTLFRSETISAFRAGIIVSLGMATLAATSPDFGPGVGALLAVVGGLLSSVQPVREASRDSVRRQARNGRLGGMRADVEFEPKTASTAKVPLDASQKVARLRQRVARVTARQSRVLRLRRRLSKVVRRTDRRPYHPK